MRKLIFAINVTLDGCCSHTKGSPGEEVHDYFTALMREVDLIVYGRITYELMVPFWPDMAKSNVAPTKSLLDFAHGFDALPKVVFSRTLERVDDRNSRLVKTDLATEITRLKNEPGKGIMVGGVALPTELLELGLVDEFIVVVHPVVAGAGRRLFDTVQMPDQLGLKLEETRVLESGHVVLRYSK
jgi:dihydrofolate reductase